MSLKITKKVQIHQMIASLDRAGTEVVCLNLSRILLNRGYSTIITATEESSGTVKAEIVKLGLFYSLLGKGRFRRILRFIRLIIKEESEGYIFHYFNIDHVLLSLIIRLLSPKSKIIVVQGNPHVGGGKKEWKVKLILYLTRALNLRLVSVSSFIQESMRSLGSLPRKSAVIYNGVDFNDYLGNGAKPSNAELSGDYNITMVARFNEIKDQITLVYAFREFCSLFENLKVYLNLVGDGECLDLVKQQCQSLGITSRVRFLGRRKDIPEILRQSDVFVLSTTRREGFGVVLIEALAASLPVIASDVPACREVLQDGRLGLLFNPHDENDLFQKLCLVFNGGFHRKYTLSEISATYSSDTMADGYLRMLEE